MAVTEVRLSAGMAAHRKEASKIQGTRSKRPKKTIENEEHGTSCLYDLR